MIFGVIRPINANGLQKICYAARLIKKQLNISVFSKCYNLNDMDLTNYWSELEKLRLAFKKTKTTFQVIGLLAAISALFLQISIDNNSLKTIQALLVLLLAFVISYSILRIWYLTFIDKEKQHPSAILQTFSIQALL